MTPTTETGLLHNDELKDAWPVLSHGERVEAFRLLPFVDGDDFFLSLSAREQAELLPALGRAERRSRIRLLAPDDAADLLQSVKDGPGREELLALLDEGTRREVTALLAYAEDDAGGLMSPRYARVRPEMGVDEAISYLRKQARERVETIHYAYALDAEQRLVGVVSFRDLFQANPGRAVRDVMQTELITVPEEMDQEAVSRLFSEHNLLAIPVVDAERRMKGIVTVDDIVDVVQEEATEDIQKVGGMEALDAPYFDISFPRMIRKRGVWLVVLFLGEMLTATAMSFFESELDRAVVLALFV
ncbi:MAG TPA: CBS domain-containing protein, partial [Myxococcaceae bacterium]|nr:CBS domain-containing protein [Myxococcaceae bacterium]